MELEIVKFMQNHKNWEELLSNAPYFLKINHDGKYAILSYNQISSDFSKNICNEARGLIVDTTNNFKPVRMAFKKFFNIDEEYAATIDWSTATASEKIDGSIISVWYDDNYWHVSTNKGIDAANVYTMNNVTNFRNIFDIAAKNCGLDFNKLDKNMCYTFELISPENQVVIAYKDTKLYHLLTRNMRTLEEVSVDIGVEKPKKYDFTDEMSIRNIVSEFDKGHEGVVVTDANGNRVKIKTMAYFIMHNLASNMQLLHAIELIRNNDQAEFLSYFKEYEECFNVIKTTIDIILRDAKKLDGVMLYLRDFYEYTYRNSKNCENTVRKRFAKTIRSLNLNLSEFAFMAYDGQCYDRIKNSNTRQFIRYTRKYWIKFVETFSDMFSIEELNV